MKTEQQEAHERVRKAAVEMLSALNQIETRLRTVYRDRNVEAVYLSARRAAATGVGCLGQRRDDTG
jgi:hypothetical protein